MKKRLFTTLLLLLTLAGFTRAQKQVYLFSSFKDNGQDGLHLAYSTDGYHFNALNNDSPVLAPTVASDKLMRDPCIIQGPDSIFHMVWTVSWNDRGIGYASSPDLIHWSPQRFIPVMEQEPTALNCWAPELIYDADSARYMIYWATTIPGRFEAGSEQGDNKYNHRMYYTTTKDFIRFDPAKLLYDQGFNVIDATIQKINGQYLMFLKDETRTPPKKHIRIAASRRLTGGYKLISEPITPDWVEGPTVSQVDGAWIVYFDEYTRHHMGAVRSVDLKNWENISDSVSFPDGTRHGTIFKVNEPVLTRLLHYFQ